jgi:hypothetical protein
MRWNRPGLVAIVSELSPVIGDSAVYDSLFLGTRRAQNAMPRRWATGFLLLALAVVVVACSRDDTYLPALLDDPMASYEAPGIELAHSWQEAEGRDVVMDVPTHAEVGRTYRILDQDQAEAILADAVAFAESSGWLVEPSRISPTTGYGGTKELPPGVGRLGVSLGVADPIQDPNGPRVLTILLDFDRSIRDTTKSLLS